MNTKAAIVLLSGLVCACAPVPAPAPAPPAPAAPPPAAAAPAPITPAVQATADHYVTILRATCDTYLALAPDDRAAASMFYIGYQARRVGTRAVNVSAIPSIEGLALDYCSFDPRRTVASAFAEAYREARGW